MDKKRLDTITVKEIAKIAGLSPYTVYAILSERKNCFASQKTKEKVKKIAKELGYRPNFIARSLKKGKTYTIGFICGSLNLETTLNRLEIITNYINKKNYHLLIGCSYKKSDLEEKLLEEFYYRKVDGIILISVGKRYKNKFLERLVEINFPIVSYTKIEGLDIDYVSTDYFYGGYLGGKHLIECGYKKIGFLGCALTDLSIKERFEGFKKALVDYKYSIDEKNFIILKSMEDEEILKSCEYILESEIDGIFAENDITALTLLQFAMRKGKKIPEELGIVGFDDIQFSKIYPLSLTTIKQPIEKISKEIFKILIKKIEGKDSKKYKILIRPELIKRETTRLSQNKKL
ncbi:MAG: LacI family transcriptional regulator [Candidatus Omnitrophica bacterium]|nr:LacI family transcriptional regulator [Candidatus Omnitrophota bacterium]MCM8802383.1 LacI family transcriptional regulator [Candidatus Omnitrophota bacterium]